VFPAIGLFIPYIRFRDAHLEHHNNEILTDPYDDPESFYLCSEVWAHLPAPLRLVLWANNTLLGRMVLGPLIGQITFMMSDFRAIAAGNGAVLRAWLVHIPAVALVLLWLLTFATIPLWAYILAAYLGLSILKIRTFLEHRAHETEHGRSVIIEERGPLALLFLNNNYHAAHHAHPNVPWYHLPKLYQDQKQKFLTHNLDYRYRSYAEVFRAYFLHPKEPVEHPYWSLGNRTTPPRKPKS
jgi:fatty acid desaturase